MCYSLWYNAPTMLQAGGQQHRDLNDKEVTLLFLTEIAVFKQWAIMSLNYIHLGSGLLLAFGWQHRGCIIPQVVTHSLVLLKMGKIISGNMLS